MLPILPVGELAGALGYGPGGWIRLQANEEGKLLLAAYGIVFDWTATQDVTYVDITGLDINRHWGYWIYIALYNPTASTTYVHLYLNGDYTPTNYYFQYIRADATTIEVGRANNPGICSAFAGERLEATIFLTLAPGGVVYAFVNETRRPASSIQLLLRSLSYVQSVSNITSLRFYSTVSGGIGAGSRILIYKLK